VQDDIASKSGDVGVLDGGRAQGHGDGGGDFELACRVCYTLCVITYCSCQSLSTIVMRLIITMIIKRKTKESSGHTSRTSDNTLPPFL
jgi:hypothetical protein